MYIKKLNVYKKIYDQIFAIRLPFIISYEYLLYIIVIITDVEIEIIIENIT